MSIKCAMKLRDDIIYLKNQRCTMMLENQENLDANCFLCDTTQRLQSDHFEEYHSYNRPPTRREIRLCRYCYLNKGLRKIRETNHIETVQELRLRLDKDPKLKRTLRYLAETEMSTYDDSNIYPITITVKYSEIYDTDLEFNF